jgi:type IV secretory pathway TraG/TraD family ATPase VirD4
MWHDARPPLPSGGHRPPDAPPFTSPGDQLLALSLGATGGVGALVWATGQLAGLAFGHTWLDMTPVHVAHVLWHLPRHWSDPALAWPADVRGPLPSAAGMYTSFAGLIGSISGGTAAVLRHLPGRAAGHRPGHPRPAKHAGAVWAGNRELRLLTVREPQPGRVILGRTPGVLGRLLAAEDCHSVLVFGPTGSYKTSALVIPGVLEWSGPMLATSVKPDLLRATMAHRARLGQVLVVDPLGASGVKAAKWSPLASCGTWAGAQQMAVMLANAIEQTPTEEQRPEHRFWKTMGTKFLAPMLYAAAVKGLSMAEVLHWLDSREDQQIKDILDAAGVPAALDAWESSQYRTDRAVDSLYATAEEVLAVYANQRVAASTDGHDLDLDAFLSGDNTIYLYAPAHQQRLLRPLFETITQQVVAAAQEQAALAPDGMLNPRLGLFLDEAGNCAALSDLDVLATTARGQGIQLVTVWHDKSQLEARYGTKASTILNNHRAKLFLSGLADLSALELGARLIGDQALVDRNRSMGSDGRHSLNESTSYRPLLPVEDLRRLRPGEGVLLYGHLRPTPIRLRPFYTAREQHRRDRAEQRTARRVARAERRLGRKTERAFNRMQRRRRREQGQAAAAPRVVWPQREGGRR